MRASARVVVVVMLALPFAMGIVWLLALPPAHGPDEEAHIDYVRTLVQTHRFPTLGFSQGEGWTEGHQPPLYYALCAALSPFLGVGWSLRWLSLVLSVLSLVASYGIARKVLPPWPKEAACMAATAGLLPMFSFLSVTVNNGALLQLLVAVSLFIGVHPASWRGLRGIVASAVVACAILTKLSALFLLPWLLFSWLRMTLQRRLPWREFLDLSGRLLLVVTLVAGWWFWRTWVLYGDPFGWHQQMASSPALVRTERVTPGYLYAVTVEIWRSLWAAFGPSARRTAGPSVYIVVSIVAGIGATGIVRSLWPGTASRVIGALLGGGVIALLGWPLAVPWFAHRYPAAGSLPIKLLLTVALGGILALPKPHWWPPPHARSEIGRLALAFLLLLLGVYRYNVDFPQPQGRFLLPTAPALVFFVELGWIALLGWERRWWVMGGALSLALAGNVAALVTYGS